MITSIPTNIRSKINPIKINTSGPEIVAWSSATSDANDAPPDLSRALAVVLTAGAFIFALYSEYLKSFLFPFL